MDRSKVIIEYWLGIIEHTCGSADPIGACLRCDLYRIHEEMLGKSRFSTMSADTQDPFESADHDNDDYTYSETYNPQQTK